MQALSLAPIAELKAARERRKIQVDLAENRKPASVCPMIRKGQVEAARRDPDFLNWSPKVWSSEGFYSQLLSPLLRGEDVRGMLLHGNIYHLGVWRSSRT